MDALVTSDRLAGAHVVVTGSSGFIGSVLVDALTRAGARVTGIDRRRPHTRSRATYLRANIGAGRDASRVGAALRSADVVFHLAGLPGVRATGPDVERARWRDNVVAGAAVLDATPQDVPVVVTSSSSVYGGAVVVGGHVLPSRETDPLLPRGGYARSKVALENLCARRASAGGRVVVARPFTVAGEGQRHDMALAGWLAAAASDEPIVVLGSLDRRRDVTDVRDVVRGLVAAAGLPTGVVVNLGSGQMRCLGELVAAVEGAVGRPCAVRVVPVGADDPDTTCADTARCEQLLGFAAQTDLDDVVRRQWERQLGTTHMSWATSRGTT